MSMAVGDRNRGGNEAEKGCNGMGEILTIIDRWKSSAVTTTSPFSDSIPSLLSAAPSSPPNTSSPRSTAPPAANQQPLPPSLSLTSSPPEDPIPDLRRVCHEWGAFHIVNHDILVRLLQEMKAAMLGFFEIPMEMKLRYACDSGSATTEGYRSRMLAKEDKVLDWRDYFDHHTLPELRRNSSRWPDFS